MFLLVFAFTLSAPAVWSANGNGEDQGEDPLNIIDDLGRKQGKWIYFGKDRPEAGFPVDGKIEEGPYIDDRKEGTWIKYHNDGVTPKLKGEYKNNRPSGAYIKIWPDGTPREMGIFSRGKHFDSLSRMYENGVVEYQAVFNDAGKEQGTVKYFYPNGQEEFVYESQSGVPTGKAVRYYENGDIKEIIFYAEDGSVEKSEPREMVNPAVVVGDPGIQNSVPAPGVGPSPRTKGAKFQSNGYNKVYNDNDEIWQDGDFRAGKLWDGKVYEYDSDGILLTVKVFKNGVYHSEGQL